MTQAQNVLGSKLVIIKGNIMIKIGNAPCSWGVEFSDDPRNPSWRKVLAENSQAGFTGIELGPVGFMPEDPSVLSEALDEYKRSSGTCDGWRQRRWERYFSFKAY
mgnify:CR=1 FL=1